jgi:nitric oxide synthase-interacting protein
MGRGQRHSKNAGVMGAESLSYHERKAMGIGTFKERMGKDSHGNYYDCSLTLQPAIDPVVTPAGYVYSREAILENLLAQKKAIRRKLAQWEEQQKEQQRKVWAGLPRAAAAAAAAAAADTGPRAAAPRPQPPGPAARCGGPPAA